MHLILLKALGIVRQEITSHAPFHLNMVKFGTMDALVTLACLVKFLVQLMQMQMENIRVMLVVTMIVLEFAAFQMESVTSMEISTVRSVAMSANLDTKGKDAKNVQLAFTKRFKKIPALEPWESNAEVYESNL